MNFIFFLLQFEKIIAWKILLNIVAARLDKLQHQSGDVCIFARIFHVFHILLLFLKQVFENVIKHFLVVLKGVRAATDPKIEQM